MVVAKSGFVILSGAKNLYSGVETLRFAQGVMLSSAFPGFVQRFRYNHKENQLLT